MPKCVVCESSRSHPKNVQIPRTGWMRGPIVQTQNRIANPAVRASHEETDTSRKDAPFFRFIGVDIQVFDRPHWPEGTARRAPEASDDRRCHRGGSAGACLEAEADRPRGSRFRAGLRGRLRRIRSRSNAFGVGIRLPSSTRAHARGWRSRSGRFRGPEWRPARLRAWTAMSSPRAARACVSTPRRSPRRPRRGRRTSRPIPARTRGANARGARSSARRSPPPRTPRTRWWTRKIRARAWERCSRARVSPARSPRSPPSRVRSCPRSRRIRWRRSCAAQTCSTPRARPRRRSAPPGTRARRTSGASPSTSSSTT